MATHSSILAWEITWMQEPGGPQSRRSQRVGEDWAGMQAQGNNFSLKKTVHTKKPKAGNLKTLSCWKALSVNTGQLERGLWGWRCNHQVPDSWADSWSSDGQRVLPLAQTSKRSHGKVHPKLGDAGFFPCHFLFFVAIFLNTQQTDSLICLQGKVNKAEMKCQLFAFLVDI